MTSYGLNNLDIKLLEYLNFKNGFFIEAGSNDGLLQSNTCLLEKEFGWKGLLIEPNFSKYKQCKNNRPNSIVENYALVSSNYKSEFIEGDFLHDDNYHSLMSMVQDLGEDCYHPIYPESDNGINFFNASRKLKKEQHNIVKVPTITLTNILEKNNIKHIDFMSLDVEGYELSVLNGLDFNKFNPTYFLIETTSYEDRKKLILDFMKSKNYSFVNQLSINDILLKYNPK